MKRLSGTLSTAAVASACVVAPMSGLSGQGSSRSDARHCAPPTSVPPVLSPDSIGFLRLDEPLGRLRERCRAVRDTTLGSSGAVGAPYPGLVFEFDSLTVLALQYGAATLDLGRAADGWLVRGTRATIAGKVSLSAPWSALYAALGTAQATARAVLAVRFCGFPNAIFTLSVAPAAVATQGGPVDLASIPPDATIDHVFIMSRSLASHLLGC